MATVSRGKIESFVIRPTSVGKLKDSLLEGSSGNWSLRVKGVCAEKREARRSHRKGVEGRKERGIQEKTLPEKILLSKICISSFTYV